MAFSLATSDWESSTSSGMAERRLMDRISNALEEKSLYGDGSSITEDDLILARGIDSKKYLKMMDKEKYSPFKTALKDGKVIAIELPLYGQHAQVCSRLSTFFDDFVLCYSELTINLGGNRNIRNADFSIAPAGAPRPPPGTGCNHHDDRWPIVIFEVGVSQEFSDLYSIASDYFDAPNSEVQLYVVVKFYMNTNKMFAIVYKRGNQNPLQAISFGLGPLAFNTRDALLRGINEMTGVGFGDPLCNALGMQEYQLHLPAPQVFHGDPTGIPPGRVEGYDIDLFRVQRWFITG